MSDLYIHIIIYMSFSLKGDVKIQEDATATIHGHLQMVAMFFMLFGKLQGL